MSVNYLIVISILEGKNFPVRHDKLLVVEAKFDGEVMSTDPVQHISRPDFNTELAWEVDKKGLQMHRLQRTPIKLLWYAIDLELTRKETIGYIILDIRLAQEKLQNPKWLPLLNSKYQKEKPEVLLCLFLERVFEQISSLVPNGNALTSHGKASTNEEKNLKKKPNNSSSNRSLIPTSQNNHSHAQPNLKPILLLNSGRYQIGPSELCTEKFIFSITLSFAANLNKLTPPAMLKSSKGFYFYYSLFENDVTTETFSVLSNPDFPAQRASVKIYTSAKLLSEYFEQHPSLEIILACGDISLGSGQIPLGPLACVNKHNIDQEPLCVEGSVPILPTEKTSRSGGDDLSPFVGVTVVLQKDKSNEGNSANKDQVGACINRIEENHHSQPEWESARFPNSGFILKETCSKNEEVQTSYEEPTNDNGSPRQNECSNHNSIPNQHIPSHHNHSNDGTPPEVTNIRNLSNCPASIAMTADTTMRHFSFALDLCSFTATRLAHPINLFIRYSYPFFGSTTSVVTHPDIEIHPKREASIPHGYCAFDFETTFASLKSTFWETPLTLEVLNKKKGGQEQLVGIARINLFQILDAPPLTHTVDKKVGTRQTTSCKVVVTSPEGYDIGEIYAVLILFDMGCATVLCDRHANQTNATSCPQVKARSLIPEFNIPLLRQNGLTQDELLQAALELELWQQRQQEIFRSQLKDKEMQHLSILTSEWKQRDMEREMLLQTKLQECKKLEDKLKQTLHDAELKEKQLSAQEAEISLRISNMDKQQEQQQKETKNRIEAIKMEYNELLTLERLNVRDLEQKNNSLIRQIKELDKELQEQRNLIDSLKVQVNKDPDVQLRTEVNILNMEKAELQQKLETALASKQKYKLQWGQAVRQISLLQQKLHLMERLELAKKDEEVATLQQRIIASEEKNSTRNNKDIMEIVKQKVESLKSQISPENAKLLERQENSKLIERQMSLDMDKLPIFSSLSSIIPQKPNTFDNLPNSNNMCLNTNVKQVAESSKENTITTNANASTNVKSSVNTINNAKSNVNASNLIMSAGDTSDMNGNTKPKEYSMHVQNLIAQKEKLLTSGGYTEDHQIIRDLNMHIDKAKLVTK